LLRFRHSSIFRSSNGCIYLPGSVIIAGTFISWPLCVNTRGSTSYIFCINRAEVPL
jgi:hypothetical protein